MVSKLFQDTDVNVHVGDCQNILSQMPEKSFNTCVTSPPYFNLRDYNIDGQIGLEQTPEEYIQVLVEVFRGVWRVLRDDGTLWLNIGDSYAANRPYQVPQSVNQTHDYKKSNASKVPRGLKPKDLLMIPARVALALQADGWYLRSEIIWNKPNPMPESVKDRPTNAHEKIFLLSKQPKYYYDSNAILEDFADARKGNPKGGADIGGRNRRNVWTVTKKPYKGAHFATYPPDLIKPCILAGAPKYGRVLDPFAGSGTTGIVSLDLDRNVDLIELNPDYVKLMEDRFDFKTFTYGD